MCSLLFWGECEDFPGDHGSDWIFRLLPLMRCLWSLDLNMNLRKRNGIGSLSTSLILGLLVSFLCLAPVKLECLKGMWEWLLFFLLRRQILNMMTNLPRLTCIPICVAVWICAGSCISGRWHSATILWDGRYWQSQELGGKRAVRRHLNL